MQTNQITVAMAVLSHLGDLAIRMAPARVQLALRFVKALVFHNPDLTKEVTAASIRALCEETDYSPDYIGPWPGNRVIDHVVAILESIEPVIDPRNIVQLRFVKQLMKLNPKLESRVSALYLDWLYDKVAATRDGIGYDTWKFMGIAGRHPWSPKEDRLGTTPAESDSDVLNIVPVTKRAFIYDSSQAGGPYVDVTEWENQDGVDIMIEDQSGTRSISLLYDEWKILCDMMSRLAQGRVTVQ